MIIQTGMRTDIPAPMLSHMDALEPYGQYWFVTITPYGRDVEPNVPDKEKVMEDFKRLSEIVGADSIGWRYDPIFIDDKHTMEWHISEFPKRKNNQRNGQCACLFGVDIGAYDTCGHLCKYCYANTSADLVKENMKKHDPASPFLLGGNMPGDVIHEAKQKSWIDGQMRLEI